MKMTTTKDEKLTKVRALLFGDSGIGKTTSLRTLPVENTIIAIGERGALPLRKHDYKAVIFNSWDDIRAIAGWFLAPDKIEDADAKKSVVSCRVLAIDSLSEISSMCMRHIVEVDRKKLISDRTRSSRDTPQGVYEDQMTMEDWGLYKTRMLRLVSTFCHLPVHLIFTCLAAWSKDKQGADTYRTPGLSGKAAFEAPAYFDEVFYMVSRGDGEENTRLWQTFNDGRILAKDASGALDPYEPADWTKVFKKILAKES